ncbi:hypothetical protein [Chamaesiphon sp. VAR_48_metabat_135_sub]|uniref:hypothetical protein n=1 Tax=Chamaesiphon sp. VAR_48_metabat_135_sub TaxID=2964699 RepID=UPI00286A9926|nr:hypothetical protein [Chamaesiphon sp. VAR_48_metabat_135_sub]
MVDRLPTSRNPTISVIEVRSIGIEEHFYILSRLSIDLWCDGFGIDRVLMVIDRI